MSDNEEDDDTSINDPYESDSSSDMIINTKISQIAMKGGEQDSERSSCWGKDRIGCELL